ncbi:tRNA (adenosine(37)-N6)-threonylcarbamoyltransferase complex transferase subunit TsaD [Patescibacteria group bacterium]|nr:tRNA (adenosine(37)-N6)-threonylcarbamoyltransferase complex transferase subunit TsaD [Patescibacteria group bacterium]MBU1895870.1 tRNA (adenosine(37)-N6)-threonylcarbamoyltransferase complex transferase subunit TsaD [Patescibacteria group bacterium]
MKILGIESSCDDTSVALLKAGGGNFEILAEITASQIEVHKKYGGVVPEIAGRKHAEKILPLIESVMEGQDKPNVIAVTSGPGLMTGLLVGIEATKTLSYLWDIPIVRVNHIEGHIYSTLIPSAVHPFAKGRTESRDLSKLKSNLFITSSVMPTASISKDSSPTARNDIAFPALCLIVSGGHTELILMKDYGKYELIGKTRDDAVGECFDKVAKLVGFDYPGGPMISKYAENGNSESINFPRPMLKEGNFDFSFSGLKTSALYWLKDNSKQKSGFNTYNLKPKTLSDFCASFETAITDVLVTKTIRAAKKYNPKTIILGGGVSANKKLKELLQNEITKHCPLSTFYFPLSTYSMDNATMIAITGYYHSIKKNFTPWSKVEADPNWKVYEKQTLDVKK